MKKEFFDILDNAMEQNKDIYLLFGGLGYPRVDEFLEKYPNRAINCEASEQTMLDIAVGLAYEKKIPVCYTITPFLLRGFETIRTYINYENLHVLLIGAGRDDDYSKDDGYSHDARDIFTILSTQENIIQWYPEDKEELQGVLQTAINTLNPTFISLRR
jgi:transketolase